MIRSNKKQILIDIKIAKKIQHWQAKFLQTIKEEFSKFTLSQKILFFF
jgi:hypothetical protein